MTAAPDALLEESLQPIYERHAHNILPYIGDAFEHPRADRLRVMCVGINAYVSPGDWAAIRPTWFRTWFAKQEHRFYRSIRRAPASLAPHLTERGRIFEGATFDAATSFYVTNAIKVYVPEATGKRADQLDDTDFDRHREQWHDELRVLAHHGAFPHVIIVFGAPFWGHAWSSLHTKGPLAAELEITRYVPGSGSLLHHANRIAHRAHETLLLRLRHPSARTKVGSVRWLIDQPGFAAFATGSPGRAP